ncbi:uncharacterized protein [Triticum aestivum]|uniref:uncharacterized protein n=1 Tax=Triticum aestivum TaxID=4565 RepID=UPI001D02BBDF|nr:uncharacterized protein LOC123090417 [Triticum aestivum]
MAVAWERAWRALAARLCILSRAQHAGGTTGALLEDDEPPDALSPAPVSTRAVSRSGSRSTMEQREPSESASPRRASLRRRRPPLPPLATPATASTSSRRPPPSSSLAGAGFGAMASSPNSVVAPSRRAGDRPVVSGLGISSCSESSGAAGGHEVSSRTRPAEGAAAAGAGASGLRQVAPWAPAPMSKKTLWRRRHDRDLQALQQRPSPPSSSPRREMSPDMDGLCFWCLQEGHFRHDCTNPIVCIRCSEEGHGTRGCKRPRSPTSEAELRRQAVAMVARRTSRSATPSSSSLPPPPPPSLAPVEAWPRLGTRHPLPPAPRLQMQMDTAMVPSELCVVRRTPAMDDLERRLQLAMVVYAGGARREISSELVVEALQDKAGILAKRVSIHRHRPEDYLVIFPRAEDRNRVSNMPVMEHRGVRLYFRQWIRQAQAVHAAFQFKVKIVMEGIPPHAWEREVAETLLGSSCMVDVIEPETCSRSDLSAFRLTAWTAQPEEIPSLRWLAVPEPGMRSPLMEPTLLQYKVLIHVDEIADYTEAEEPQFLGASSGSEQSGLPEDPDALGMGGERGPTRLRKVWRFGVRDERGGAEAGGGIAHGGGARSTPAIVEMSGEGQD